MTELYWQRYINQVSLDPLHNKNEFWEHVRAGIAKKAEPKHHLELYSMCRSDNPYIRQVRNSPNITNDTVSQLICRDKACELQYCMSLMKTATENRRRIIDLKGCKEQYETMRNCINVERTNLIKREENLRNAVYGIKVKEEEKPVAVPAKVVEPEKESRVYI